MLDKAFAIIAPYPCFGCGKIGKPLCNNCEYDITSEPFYRCIACLGPTGDKRLCAHHVLPYSRTWVVGVRSEVLEQLIDAYKFSRAKALHQTFAGLLDTVLPQLPPDIVVVPVPTIATHVRQRGYDHTLLIAKDLALKKGLKYKKLIERQHSAKQLGASRSERIAQAKTAFYLTGPVSSTTTYLLLDDVYTTGATVRYAAKQLRDGGARDVWVAVVARQVSTKEPQSVKMGRYNNMER